MEQLRKLDRDLAWKNDRLLHDRRPSIQNKLGITPFPRRQSTNTNANTITEQDKAAGVITPCPLPPAMIPPRLALPTIPTLDLHLPAKPSNDVISTSYRPRALGPPSPPLFDRNRNWQEYTFRRRWSKDEERDGDGDRDRDRDRDWTRQHTYPKQDGPDSNMTRDSWSWRSSSPSPDHLQYSSSSRSGSSSSTSISYHSPSKAREIRYAETYDNNVDAKAAASIHGHESELRNFPPTAPRALRKPNVTQMEHGKSALSSAPSMEKVNAHKKQTLEVIVVDEPISISKKRPRAENDVEGVRNLSATKSQSPRSPLTSKSKWKKLDPGSSSFKSSIRLRPSLEGSDSGLTGEQGSEKESKQMVYLLQESQPTSLHTINICSPAPADACTPTARLQLEDNNENSDVLDNHSITIVGESMRFQADSNVESPFVQPPDAEKPTMANSVPISPRESDVAVAVAVAQASSPSGRFDDSFWDSLIELKVLERSERLQYAYDELGEETKQLKKDNAELTRDKQLLETEIGKLRTRLDIAIRSNKEGEKAFANTESLRTQLTLAQGEIEVFQDRITELELYGAENYQQKLNSFTNDVNAKIDNEKHLLCRNNKDLENAKAGLECRIDELELAARSADAVNAGLMDELDRAQVSLCKSIEQEKLKDQQIDGLQDSLSQRSRLMERLQLDNHKMRRDIEVKDQTVVKKDQEIKELRIRIKFVCGQREKNGADFENAQKINQRLGIDLKNKTNELQIAYTELERIEEDKIQLEKNSKSKDETIKSQTGAIHDLENERDGLQVVHEKLQSEIEALRKTDDDKDHIIAAKESWIRELNQSLVDVCKDKADLVKANETLATCKEESLKEQNEAQKRYNELVEEHDAQMKQSSRSISELKDKVKLVEREVAMKGAELCEIRRHLRDAERQHVQDRRNVCRLIAENSKLTKAINSTGEKMTSYEESVGDMRRQLERHVSDIMKLKEKIVGYEIYESFMSKADEVIRELRKENDQLKAGSTL